MTTPKTWLRSAWQMATGLFALMIVVFLIKPELVRPLFKPLFRQPEVPARLPSTPSRDQPFRPVYTPPREAEIEVSVVGTRKLLQDSPDGLLKLGNDLFQSAREINRIMPELKFQVQSEAVSRLDAAAAFAAGKEPITNPRWPALGKWFERHSDYNVDFVGFDEADRRFKALAGQPSRTEAETEELRLLVEQCGRDWLKIPYDEKQQRFDFLNVPDDAPENAFANYKEIYLILAGKPWMEEPARVKNGWEQDPRGKLPAGR